MAAVTKSHICQRVQSYTSAWLISTPCQFHHPLRPSAAPRSSRRQQLMLAGHSRVHTGLNRQPSVPPALLTHRKLTTHTRPKTHTHTHSHQHSAAAPHAHAQTCTHATYMWKHTHTHKTPGRLCFKHKQRRQTHG